MVTDYTPEEEPTIEELEAGLKERNASLALRWEAVKERFKNVWPQLKSSFWHTFWTFALVIFSLSSHLHWVDVLIVALAIGSLEFRVQCLQHRLEVNERLLERQSEILLATGTLAAGAWERAVKETREEWKCPLCGETDEDACYCKYDAEPKW